LGQILSTYIVAEGAGGLYLIDQHAAHERVLYERIMTSRSRGALASQMLAVPITLELAPAQMALVAGHVDHLVGLGFDVEAFGARTVILRSVPALAAKRGAEDLFRRALGALAGEGEGAGVMERLAIATACHTAIRAGDALSAEAVAALLADLAATEDPYTCFHGRPTIIAVPRDQLERWFLRR
jgi:DNA mismatch repair protein MutL